MAFQMKRNKNPSDVLRRLGGIPSIFCLQRFMEARCKEIMTLNQTLEQTPKGGLIFQRLPVAMRRRTMAHHTKRVPKRLQYAHARQLEKLGVPQSSKRPSRKYRRRPENLLLEYNRRQKDKIWLETHIWHAKRFHMTEKWGYKLGNYSTSKTFRSCFRASANHCLLQDISYYCCIEVNGPENIIIMGLNAHVSNTCGLTFAAKAYISGKREGSVTFFRKDSFPFGAIGPVKFIWKPSENGSESSRTIWLWVHPSLYFEILQSLINAFNLQKEEKSAISDICHSKEMKKLETHNIFDSPDTYVCPKREIVLISLKDRLNRFRLTGPLSHIALFDALHVVCTTEDNFNNPREEFHVLNSDKEEENDDSDDNENEIDAAQERNIGVRHKTWWMSYYLANKENEKVLNEQRNFWLKLENVYSTAQLPPNQVVALTVLDPRYQLPSKRMKSIPDPKVIDPSLLSNIPTCVSLSPIWNYNIRLQSSTSKLSTSEIATLRSHRLIPGYSKEEIDCSVSLNKSESLNAVPSYVPLLLIQRPGDQDPCMKRLGYGSGWDVIMPSGWAMPLWLALIFRGARPGGLREFSTTGLESGAIEHFEHFAPDTHAGQEEELENYTFRRNRHFSKPPNKRPNFTKLGVVSPFKCCWDILIQDWCQNKKDDEHYYVLRDHVKLNALKDIINSKITSCSWSDMLSQMSSIFFNINHNFLVPVRIQSLKRGYPEDNALICIPTNEDLSNFKDRGDTPIEHVHCDDNEEKRKILKLQHQKLLRKLKKQRKCAKEKLQEKMDECLDKGESISPLLSKEEKNPHPTKELVDEYNEAMKLLWVPQPKLVKDSCSRTVAGFVCKGDFSFVEANGVGFGYVPFLALINLTKVWTNKPVVLFRNISSSNYYFAELKIC